MGEVVGAGAWGAQVDRGLAVRSPAEPFVRAMEAARSGADKVAIALRALRRDPDCIEARLELAARSREPIRRMAHLHVAVEAGEVLWRGRLPNRQGTVPSGAMPWLKALRNLGEALEADEDFEAARDCLERLLEVDPTDRFGAEPALRRLPPGQSPTR